MLIIDDFAPFRAQARAVLEEEGFAVVGEAATGGDGMAAALHFHPEVVVLDVQLPDSNGFDIARQLSRELPDTTVVLVSGRDARDYGDRLTTSGAASFLPKARFSGPAMSALVDELD